MNLTRQNASTTGLFFNTQPQGNSLFSTPSNNINNNLPATSGFSLFNNPSNPQNNINNIFSPTKSEPPKGLFPSMSNINQPQSIIMNQPNTTSFMNPQQYQMGNKNEVDYYELSHLIKNYIDSLSSFKPENAFKYMLYTRYQQTPQNLYPDHYSPYVVLPDGTANCIDYDLWLKAVQENPDSNLFVPIQISSPKQFVSFLKQTEINILYALDRIIKMQKDLEVINQKTFEEISNHLAQAKTKKEQIKEKLLSVATKMARLGIYTGYAENNTILEKQIETNLTEIKENLNQESEFMQKVRTLKTGNCEIEATTIEIGDYMKDMNKIRLEKNVNALRQMKSIIDLQFNNINSNIKMINGIQDDLNHLKRYGKFK